MHFGLFLLIKVALMSPETLVYYANRQWNGVVPVYLNRYTHSCIENSMLKHFFLILCAESAFLGVPLATFTAKPFRDTKYQRSYSQRRPKNL